MSELRLRLGDFVIDAHVEAIDLPSEVGDDLHQREGDLTLPSDYRLEIAVRRGLSEELIQTVRDTVGAFRRISHDAQRNRGGASDQPGGAA